MTKETGSKDPATVIGPVAANEKKPDATHAPTGHAIHPVETPWSRTEEISGPGWKVAKTPAMSFRLPTRFPTQAEFLSLPKVVPTISISRLALRKMHIIISLIQMEVGWLGTAHRDEMGVTIDDVFLFEQDVSYGHSELTSDSMSNIMQKVLKSPGGEEIFNNTRFWGHSHGTGGTYPSSQDDETMQTFRGFGADFFLRGILNRVGKISLSLYDWQNGIAYHDTPWRIVGESLTADIVNQLREELLLEMTEKVIYQPPTLYQPQPLVSQTPSLLSILSDIVGGQYVHLPEQKHLPEPGQVTMRKNPPPRRK